MPVAGWYDDGVSVGVVRWWDGVRWTGHMRVVGSVRQASQAGSASQSSGSSGSTGSSQASCADQPAQPSQSERPAGVSQGYGVSSSGGSGEGLSSGVPGGVRPARRDRQRVRGGAPVDVVGSQGTSSGRRVREFERELERERRAQLREERRVEKESDVRRLLLSVTDFKVAPNKEKTFRQVVEELKECHREPVEIKVESTDTPGHLRLILLLKVKNFTQAADQTDMFINDLLDKIKDENPAQPEPAQRGSNHLVPA